MTRKSIVAVAAVSVLCLVPAGPAATKPKQDIRVRVLSPAKLLGDGSVRVEVRIKCQPTGDEAFEANITLSQDEGAVFGQPGLPQAPCDRRWHTVSQVVTPFDGTFHRGEAFASAFVSRLDPVTFETRQGQDVRNIRVK